ncbi:hypothetical protein LY78DRAFT_654531 [Colletotrichum sublineola]|nr:hypothetical protein LY78DRAFT_654531 [Colletotrichum sublineola]
MRVVQVGHSIKLSMKQDLESKAFSPTNSTDLQTTPERTPAASHGTSCLSGGEGKKFLFPSEEPTENRNEVRAVKSPIRSLDSPGFVKPQYVTSGWLGTEQLRGQTLLFFVFFLTRKALSRFPMCGHQGNMKGVICYSTRIFLAFSSPPTSSFFFACPTDKGTAVHVLKKVGYVEIDRRH